LHDSRFTQSSLNIYLRATNVRPAYEVGETVWRSDLIMTGEVS
jgi:hypothetical protein